MKNGIEITRFNNNPKYVIEKIYIMCNRMKYGLEKLKIYSNQKHGNNIGKLTVVGK